MEIVIIILVLVIIVMAGNFREPEMDPKPYYHQHFDNVQFSAQEFYSVIKELVAEKQISNLKVSRFVRSEGDFFSARREYLRITRKRVAIDVCGFVFGRGFYISCRKGRVPAATDKVIRNKKSAGSKVADIFSRKETFYRIDSDEAFKTFVQQSIVDAIHLLSGGRGMRSKNGDRQMNDT